MKLKTPMKAYYFLTCMSCIMHLIRQYLEEIVIYAEINDRRFSIDEVVEVNNACSDVVDQWLS